MVAKRRGPTTITARQRRTRNPRNRLGKQNRPRILPPRIHPASQTARQRQQRHSRHRLLATRSRRTLSRRNPRHRAAESHDQPPSRSRIRRTRMNLDNNPVAVAWITHCTQLRAEIAKLQDEYDRGIQAIKDAMGDEEEATIAGHVVATWRPSAPAEYLDARTLRADHHEPAAQYTKLKNAARPFRLTD